MAAGPTSEWPGRPVGVRPPGAAGPRRSVLLHESETGGGRGPPRQLPGSRQPAADRSARRAEEPSGPASTTTPAVRGRLARVRAGVVIGRRYFMAMPTRASLAARGRAGARPLPSRSTRRVLAAAVRGRRRSSWSTAGCRRARRGCPGCAFGVGLPVHAAVVDARGRHRAVARALGRPRPGGTAVLAAVAVPLRRLPGCAGLARGGLGRRWRTSGTDWPSGGMPWGRLAYAVVDTPVAGALPYVGSTGVSLAARPARGAARRGRTARAAGRRVRVAGRRSAPSLAVRRRAAGACRTTRPPTGHVDRRGRPGQRARRRHRRARALPPDHPPARRRDRAPRPPTSRPAAPRGPTSWSGRRTPRPSTRSRTRRCAPTSRRR